MYEGVCPVADTESSVGMTHDIMTYDLITYDGMIYEVMTHDI